MRGKGTKTGKYRSKFEKRVGAQLGSRAKYEAERLEYEVHLVKKYLPDFVLEWKDGTKRYIEAKGLFTPADRRKLLWVMEAHPDIDLRIVFQKDNYLTRAKSSRYSDWAEKNGFKWAVGSVPASWRRKDG